jgi:hypothetical protein
MVIGAVVILLGSVTGVSGALLYRQADANLTRIAVPELDAVLTREVCRFSRRLHHRAHEAQVRAGRRVRTLHRTHMVAAPAAQADHRSPDHRVLPRGAEQDMRVVPRTGAVAANPQLKPVIDFQVTPTLLPQAAGGHLIVCDPFSKLIALDPVTGLERWTYDPQIV